jgi:hypothetical protein
MGTQSISDPYAEPYEGPYATEYRPGNSLNVQ